ncbi:hypothetical protein [Methylobacterium platani]|uniref:Porin n=2 Tax=Methylobacterium platani TaxID=427683 RepID=A0A179SBQ7_9HYPH|nr:hypothetical protein [Methylobacterium platani]KMO10846.1 hypothetical protein SQ03_28930 [Methylobacterium platani JCM 14648]OAS25287.1 hypothetical protein A5481_10255 [Methylobacterium platani]
MTERLTLLAAAALLSLVATPLVVRAGADAPTPEPAAVVAATPAAAEAPAPACRTVRVVYAGYGAPACGR